MSAAEPWDEEPLELLEAQAAEHAPSPRPAVRAPLIYDETAESAVLGAMALFEGARATVLASGLHPHDFTPSGARWFAAIRATVDAGRTPDTVTVPATIGADAWHRAGGEEGWAGVLAGAIGSVGVEEWAARVVDCAQQRRIALALDKAHRAQLDGGDVPSALAELDQARTTGGAGSTAVHYADIGAVLDGTHEPEVPSILARDDGAFLLYAGRVNVAQGEPGAGKTWLLLLAVLDVLRAGGVAMYLDHEDSAVAATSRLLNLGAEPAELRDRFLYPDRDTPPAALVAEAERLNIDLFALDSVAEALTARGYDESSATDYLAWHRELPRAMTATGITVLLNDHVAKSKEDRGRWARGSGSKLAAMDGAVYNVVATDPPSQHRPGRFRLVLAKDRHGGTGYKPRDTVASIYLDPTRAGGFHHAIDPPAPTENDPTPDAAAAKDRAEVETRAALAELVVAVLEDATEPLSKQKVLDKVRARKDRIRFSDALLGPVLEELKDARRIVATTGRTGHDAFARLPRQEALDTSPEEGP